MKYFLRRLFVLALQVCAVVIAVVGGSAAYTLNERGLSYAETQAFQTDLILYAKVGMALAAMIWLIVWCFRITGRRFNGGMV